jgi:NADH:ubiquinone oxidoreductase subunit F (NADH-binding)
MLGSLGVVLIMFGNQIFIGIGAGILLLAAAMHSTTLYLYQRKEIMEAIQGMAAKAAEEKKG